ncbi:MAG: hypothetical protein ACTSPI_02675, partial [Candidatus Heimdallarchaeaceae archaeon]
KVENLTLYSSSISLGSDNEKYAIGRTSLTSYSLEKDGNIFQDTIKGFLTWLFAKEIEQSRIIISGSTIMFSDLNITENQKFIDEAQNKDLWLNLIYWLLHITPYEEQNPIAMPFYALVLISLGVALTAFVTAIIVYKYRQLRRISIKVKK